MPQAGWGWSKGLLRKCPEDCHHLLVQASGTCEPDQEQGQEQGAQAVCECRRQPTWGPGAELCSVTDDTALAHRAYIAIKPRNLFDLFPLLFPPSLKARLEPSFLGLKGKYLII